MRVFQPHVVVEDVGQTIRVELGIRVSRHDIAQVQMGDHPFEVLAECREHLEICLPCSEAFCIASRGELETHAECAPHLILRVVENPVFE